MVSIQELRKMTAKDLSIELSRARFSAGHIHFAIKAGQNKASHQLHLIKKFIAMVLTVIIEKKSK